MGDVTTLTEHREELEWLLEHGGGDQLADANCWRAVKEHLPPVLEAQQRVIDELQRERDHYEHEAREWQRASVKRFQEAYDEMKDGVEGPQARVRQLEQDRDDERMEYQAKFYRMRDGLKAEAERLQERLAAQQRVIDAARRVVDAKDPRALRDLVAALAAVAPQEEEKVSVPPGS